MILLFLNRRKQKHLLVSIARKQKNESGDRGEKPPLAQGQTYARAKESRSSANDGFGRGAGAS